MKKIEPNPLAIKSGDDLTIREVEILNQDITIHSYPKAKQLGRQFMEVDEYKSMAKSENELQKKCEEILGEYGLYFFHLSASAYRTHKIKKGILDLHVLIPIGNEYNLACVIELKVAKGKPSGGQKNTSRKINSHLIRNEIVFRERIEYFIEFVNKLNKALELAKLKG